MDTVLEERMRATCDKQEIHDALMRYCRGVDRGEADLIRSAFHPDGISDLGRGPEPSHATADRIVESLNKTGGATHFVGNVLVELDGDVAWSEAYFISYATVTRDGKAYTRARGGRYVDRFERRAGEWKITLRVIVDDWSRVDPVNDTQPPVRPGQRSHDDPVWAIRKGAFGAAAGSAGSGR